MARAQREGLFTADLDDFPLVRIRSPSATEYDHVDVASFFQCAELALARRSDFVLLHDARAMPYVDETHQGRFLAQLSRVRPIISRKLVAYAAVVSSPLERGLLTALGWAARMPFPTRLFTTDDEARTFLLDRYARRERRHLSVVVG